MKRDMGITTREYPHHGHDTRKKVFAVSVKYLRVILQRKIPHDEILQLQRLLLLSSGNEVRYTIWFYYDHLKGENGDHVAQVVYDPDNPDIIMPVSQEEYELIAAQLEHDFGIIDVTGIAVNEVLERQAAELPLNTKVVRLKKLGRS